MVDAKQQDHVIEDQAGLLARHSHGAIHAVCKSANVRVKVDCRDAANELNDIVDHRNAAKEPVSAVLDLGHVGWFKVETPGLDWLGDFWLLAVLRDFLACRVNFLFMFSHFNI